MSIRQSILALLEDQPRHGYELKSEFERRTGNSWTLNVGQIYTTLDRLERDGLVSRGTADAEGRVRYRITPDGQAEVRQWFTTPVVESSPRRDEVAIKLALAVTMLDLDIEEIIQRQRTASMQALQTYTRARARAGEDLAWQLIAQRLVFETEAEIRWLDDCEAVLVRAGRSAARQREARRPPQERQGASELDPARGEKA